MNTSENHSPIKHVAIIMDGNGRWAKGRAHTRVWGHVRGSRIVSDIVETADKNGVEALTLYAFSTENWSRPLLEVRTIFALLKKFLKIEKRRIIENNISFQTIGDISRLPTATQALIIELTELTKNATGLKLTFAFGYSGRSEIVHAANQCIKNNPGKLITDSDIDKYLFRPEIGEVDLLIRTGGDTRISNFLLWQLAYAELYFTETLWPDFSTLEFLNILNCVQQRERRFGTISSCQLWEDSKLMAKENLKNL